MLLVCRWITGFIQCYLHAWVSAFIYLFSLGCLKLGADHISTKGMCLSAFFSPPFPSLMHQGSGFADARLEIPIYVFKTQLKPRRYLTNPFELRQRPDPDAKRLRAPRLNKHQCHQCWFMLRQNSKTFYYGWQPKKKKKWVSQCLFVRLWSRLKRGKERGGKSST